MTDEITFDEFINELEKKAAGDFKAWYKTKRNESPIGWYPTKMMSDEWFTQFMICCRQTIKKGRLVS